MNERTKFVALIVFMGVITFASSYSTPGGRTVSMIGFGNTWEFSAIAAGFVVVLASLLYVVSFVWAPWILNQMIALKVWWREDMKRAKEERAKEGKKW